MTFIKINNETNAVSVVSPKQPKKFVEGKTVNDDDPNWIEVAAKVVAGQIYDPETGTFSNPIPKLEDLKDDALRALDEEFEKQVVELTGNKPNAERQMWMLINLSAKAFLGGDESKREFLEAQVPPLKKAQLIEAGEDVATWKANDAAKKEAITSQVVQMAMGMKKTAEEAIEAAETHEVFAATIETLKAQEATTIDAFKAAIAAQQT
jgi:hypothetical protein